MDEGAAVVRARPVPLRGEEVRNVGPCAEAPPKYVPGNKGQTSYPFESLQVGWAMDVQRPKDTVKSAVRRWRETHRAQRFLVWRLPDGWTRVKRTK